MVFGKHINRYYLRYLPVLLVGLVALIAVDYVQMIIPKLYRMLINGINTGVVELNGEIVPFNFDFLLDNVCLPMIIVTVSLVIGRFLWRICFFGSAIGMETDIRNRMFDHCKDLSREYYQVNKVGGLMALFTNDLETLHDCFGSGTLMLFDALFMGSLAMLNMIKMDPLLAVLSMIPMAIMLLTGFIMSKTMTKKWAKRQEAYAELSDFTQEIFSGMSVVKAFVKELKEMMAFRRLNVKNEETNVEYTKVSTLVSILITLFVESVICVILGYGGYLVYKGDFDAGQLIEFIGYFNSVVWPVMAISQLIEKSARGKASLKRISDLLDAKIDVADREGAEDLSNLRGEIEFRNLTFRYPDGDREVLKNVSFKINEGESVGIVGKTGCGKTTVVDLMLRMFNVPDGTFFIDGRDVNTLTVASVRRALSYVPQDNFLFSDTIENNIAFGGENTDLDSVVEAAKMAEVHSDISAFAKGYSTVLGERGVTVSGGQKQRLSIARALLKDSPILVLDDSVSAVDTKTERAILNALREKRSGRTTVLIATRISTVSQMDKIIFIEDGTVSAVGTHDHLCETCPEYKKMVDLQNLEAEGAGVINA